MLVGLGLTTLFNIIRGGNPLSGSGGRAARGANTAGGDCLRLPSARAATRAGGCGGSPTHSAGRRCGTRRAAPHLWHAVSPRRGCPGAGFDGSHRAGTDGSGHHARDRDAVRKIH